MEKKVFSFSFLFLSKCVKWIFYQQQQQKNRDITLSFAVRCNHRVNTGVPNDTEIKLIQGAALVHVDSLDRICHTQWTRTFFHFIHTPVFSSNFLSIMLPWKKVYWKRFTTFWRIELLQHKYFISFSCHRWMVVLYCIYCMYIGTHSRQFGRKWVNLKIRTHLQGFCLLDSTANRKYKYHMTANTFFNICFIS